MFGTGKSTILQKCLDKKFIEQINPSDNPYELDTDKVQKLSSAFMYYLAEYEGIKSMACIKKSIFHNFFGDHVKFDPHKFINAIIDHPNPVCIMLDEVDDLARILLKREIDKGQNPHQMQGYYDVLNAFRELSRICTVILAGKSPFLYLVGRGIYRHAGLTSLCGADHVVLQSLKEEHLMLICQQFSVMDEEIKEINLFELLDVKTENQQNFIRILLQFTGGIPRLVHCTLSGIFSRQNEKRKTCEWWMKQLTMAQSRFCEDIHDTYGASINVDFPKELIGINELKKHLYFAILSPDKLNLNAKIEINGVDTKIAVLDLFSKYCLYQVDDKKFVVPLLLLKKFSDVLGPTLTWGACAIIAGGETWERLCCVSITVVYNELLPDFFLSSVANDYTLDTSNIFTKYPKVTTKCNKKMELTENMRTIHPNHVNSFLKFVNFPGSGRIFQFGSQSAMADGLIDFGTNEFVAAIIAKNYSQEQANKDFTSGFLGTELEKLKCLVEGEKQYNTILAIFVAPFLSKTYDDAKGKLFCSGKNFLSKNSKKSLLVPVGINLLIADPEILQKEIPLTYLASLALK